MSEEECSVWFEIALETESADAETVGALLARGGFGGCELRETDDGRAHVVVYARVEVESAARELVERMLDFLPAGLISGYELCTKDEKIWTENWRKFFPRLRIGSRLEILPPWEAPSQEPGRLTVIINPALAFGTGHHETTAGCLEVLDAVLKMGDQVADIGCGSGILSIAAVKLGAAYAFACDVDEQAVSATCDNAIRNDVQESIHVERVSASPSSQDYGAQRYDVVMANIIAETLVELRDRLTSCVKPGGHLVLSGIAENHSSLIGETFLRSGWVVSRRLPRGDWVTLALRREERLSAR